MGNTNHESDRKFGRGILSPQQTSTLVDNIRKIQVANNGLTKKAIVTKAFTETFGSSWPIQPVSSTIARYWKYSFPSDKVVRLNKRRGKRSLQPLLDDLRRQEPPATKVDQSNTQIHMCPKCHCRFAVTIFDP